MTTVLEAINGFLLNRRDEHNNPAMIDLITTPGMEMQVNVTAGDGKPVEGRRNTWTNGDYEWWNIRVPKDANSEPHFNDYPMTFPLELHTEAVGTTGWNWKDRSSLWVGFDFDAITGHAVGVGVEDEELAKIAEIAQGFDFVEVRKSTSGAGIHLGVHLDGIPTENHMVHAALARSILTMMSQEAGFNFAGAVDACGHNVWFWSRRTTKENQGFAEIKAATRTLTEKDVPANWRDNLDVVTHRRSNVRVRGVPETEQGAFEAMATARSFVTLDEKHHAIMTALRESGFTAVWNPDFYLMQTHTQALAKVHKELDLKGVFSTNSPGSDPGQANCFMFPLYDGAWKVFRFSQGIMEAATWVQDGQSWTTCYYNRDADLHAAAAASGGVELAGGKGFQFMKLSETKGLFEALGTQERIDQEYANREGDVYKNTDGRLVAKVKAANNETPIDGWAKKRGYLEKIFAVTCEKDEHEIDSAEVDNTTRCLITSKGTEAGWRIKTLAGDWVQYSKDNVKSALAHFGYSKSDADKICGGSILRPWKLVNLPFQAEYPGQRQWNIDAAQYRFQPLLEPGEHPTWDRILRHCGEDLDCYLDNEEWAQQAGIKTGGDYLTAWIAAMLREPFEPLPYLFFFGDQNSGKSIFHEAVSLLITKGCVSADRALTNPSDFNGELANAILCYVEEKDISIAGAAAYNKIKDWCTGKTIWIRKMRTDAYEQANCTHWVQCSNHQTACPVFPGDTRITMIQVADLEPGYEIPKSVLLELLEKEAPAFMRTLLDLTLPKVIGRLRIPIVKTHHKTRNEEANMNPVEEFISENLYEVAGQKIPFKEFYERFIQTLNVDEKHTWTRQKVVKHLPDKIAYGTAGANVRYIGNYSWESLTEHKEQLPKLTIINGKLVPKETEYA